jgi:ribosome modulation factor
MTVDEQVKSILSQMCPYKEPPLVYLGGHQFCPCITEAIRQAYIGGYRHGKTGMEPEVGSKEENPSAA